VPEESGLTIGELARRAGVGVETVRFYEREGLVPRPPRPTRGFRRYPEHAVERIRFVRQARELGFTLAEAGELLALRARADAPCTGVRARAAQKLEEIDRRIAELTELRGALATLVDACAGEVAVRDCAILDAMASPSERASTRTDPTKKRSRKRASKRGENHV
jgi:Hg(II)-responsive transcriptional regulator